jgi:response regulator RpfG family c-di-GMP phosphodiesterase
MDMNASLDSRVQVRTAQLQTALSDIRRANQDLKQQYADTVRAFSKMIELREGSASGHPRRVAERARRLGETLGMTSKDQQNLVFASLLLEIGKVTLPDKLLNRPLNALFVQERDTFLHHAVIGASLLKNITPLKEAAQLIAPQYECFDGSGKPAGLIGEKIPLGSRILAVVRDYDLYLEGKLTGKMLTASDAQGQLRRLRGKKYDPKVVDELLKLVGEVKDTVYRPTVEASFSDLVPGMEIIEVTHGDSVFLRDAVLTLPMIEEIKSLQQEVGTALSIKIKARK